MPISELEVYFGPQRLVINGIETETFFFPFGPAIMGADFTSPSLDMVAWDGQSELTITNGATYTTSAVVGRQPLNDYVPGGAVQPAVLNLEGGASIDGSLVVGSNSLGVLNILSGTSTLNSLTLGQSVTGHGTLNIASGAGLSLPNGYNGGNGTVTIGNAGTFFLDNEHFRSSDISSWQNLSGGSIELLGNGADFDRSSALDVAVLTNDAGASLIKTGVGTSSTIQWDLVNNGLLDVQAGTLRVQEGFAGSGTATIAPGSQLTFSGAELTADASLHVTGELERLDFDDSQGHTLTLSGAYSITHNNFLSDVENIHFRNGGQALVVSDDFRSRGPASWRNLSGGSIELAANSTDFVRGSSSDVAVLTNDPGGSLIKSGVGTNSTIRWDLKNNGLIDVKAGTLTVSEGFAGDGTATIALGGQLTFSSAELTADASLHVTGELGRVSFRNDQMQTLALSGIYTITHGGFLSDVENVAFLNSGQAVVTSNDDFRSQGPASWRNLSGGSIELAVTSADFIKSDSSDVAVLINDAGGSVIKSGAGTNSSIRWDLLNNGLIDIQAGTLTVSEGFAGDGTATIAPGGQLAFSGAELTADASLHVTGELGRVSFRNDQMQTLSLSGVYTITHGNFLSDVENIEFLNSGQAAVTSSDNFRSQGDVTWRNLSGGSIELAVASADFSRGAASDSAVLANDPGGSLIKSGAGTTSSISWDLQNNGLVDIQAGKLSLSRDASGIGEMRVQAGAELAFSGDVLRQALITLDPAGVFDFNGDRLEVIDFDGSFTHDRGVYAPGASPAVSTLTGDYTLVNSNATLEIEIDGTALGEFDQLTVDGAVDLNGKLSIVTLENYVPVMGDSFVVLKALGGLSGDFSEIDGMQIGGGPGYEVTIDYLTGTVSLETVLPGDLNGDGFVGISDLSLVLANWNQSIPPGDPLSDPSGDGFVGIDDLNIILGNWNGSFPPAGSISLPSAAIPEPSLLGVIGMGVLGLISRRRV